LLIFLSRIRTKT